MARNESHNVYQGVELLIDGTVYDSCVFNEVRLIFEGGPPPSFNNCRFNGSKFIFKGPAQNTVEFLRAMAGPQSGLQPIVKEMFSDLFL